MFLVRRPFASVSRIFVLSLAAPMFWLHAQDPSWEGKRVAAIQFEPSRQPLDPAEINQILPLKWNRPLRLADVRASIERLFATGRYADIQVDAEPYQDGVVVRFVTKNSWFIGHVVVTGKVSNPPSAAQLENAAQLDLGAPYTQANLTAAEAGQKKLLESNGLFGGNVRPVLDWDNDYQQVQIRFEVDSGPRARFTDAYDRRQPPARPRQPPARHRVSTLAHPHLETDDADAAARGERGRALALRQGSSPGSQGDAGRREVRRRDQSRRAGVPG